MRTPPALSKLVPFHQESSLDIPSSFCWTKFGAEAGEQPDSIRQRKEQERKSNDGLFLWGIGNSVGKAIAHLAGIESQPFIIFSPIRTKPRKIDESPSGTVVWTEAHTLDGSQWQIPSGSLVTSRSESANGKPKDAHYALVCYSKTSLLETRLSGEIVSSLLTNLMTGSAVGFSQVTSVVKRVGTSGSRGPSYSIGFSAVLHYPYFIRLSRPQAVAR